MNLLAGLLFLLLEIALIAGPHHLRAILLPDQPADGWVIAGQVAGLAAGLSLAAAVTILPLRAGGRAQRDGVLRSDPIARSRPNL